MEINKTFGFSLEKYLISQFHINVWRCWGNRIRDIIPNYFHKEDYIIIGSRFDFTRRLRSKRTINIKKGVNTLRLNKLKIKGDWHMVTVKFFVSKLFMKVKRKSLMGDVYGRIGRWIGVDPRFIRFDGKLHPEGTKLIGISPETQVINETNRVTKIKLELSSQMIYNVKMIMNEDDSSQMKKFLVGGQIYNLYKFLKVKSFKRIIMFNSKIMGQWPNLHDASNGIMFIDMMEIDRISTHLMTIWSPIMNKVFKVWLEGSLKAKVEEDINCSIGEFIKRTRKIYGLASDCVLTDANGKEYS
jgi:hypothetical protein